MLHDEVIRQPAVAAPLYGPSFFAIRVRQRQRDATRRAAYSHVASYDSLFFFFLATFRNEITTILTPSTSQGGEWGLFWHPRLHKGASGGGHVFRFEGPWLRIRNVIYVGSSTEMATIKWYALFSSTE